MIKAVFFDIDGTLRDYESGKIPESAKEAVNQARKKGILCFAATGRHILEIQQENLLEDLVLDGYVTLNGQYCLDREGRVLYANPVPQDQVRTMLQLIEEEPFPCMFMEAEAMYINFVNDLVRQVQAGINTRIPPVLSLSRGLENPVYQMVPCCREEKAEKILSDLPGCRGVKWHDGLAVDVLPKNGAKERGISHVLSSYGIAREECAAIGDGYNDISMIRWAGTGIAMKNGKEETRRWADYITGSVMEDGIHQAIVHLLGRD